jgi:exodeoxyribonuclease V beta subunit
MLHEFAVESGTAPDTELITDDSELFRETAADFYRSFFLQPGKELQCIIATQNNFTLSAIEKFARTVMKNPDCAVADRDEIAPTDSFEQQFTEIIQQFLEIIDYFLSDYYANQEVFKTDLKKTLAIVCSSLSKYKSDFIQIGRIFCTLANVNFESGKLQKCSWQTKNQILPESFARINELAQKYSAIVEKYIRSIKLAFIEYSRRPDTMAAKKRLRQVNTFDDLLVNTQQALQNNPSFAQRIRQRFKVVMIDEFQDTDPVQYYIFNTVFNHPEALMLVVGDPKQSIYSFRGADIYSYLGAVKKISDTDVYSLTRNYRSSQQLLDSFNNLFNHSNPFIEQKITYHNATAGREIGQLVVEKSNYFNAPLEFCNVFDPNKQKGNRGRAGKNALAETVARVAELLHRANQLNHQGQPRARFEFNGKFVPVKASDIAILTDTNREAIILRELLSRVGVPAVMQNSGKIFATNEASELYHILKAVLNPANKKMLFSALITSCFSLDAAAIDALNTSEGDNEQLESYRLKFCLLQEIWLTKGFMPMFFKLQEDNVHRIALPAMLERHLTDLAHLAELLHQASRTRQLGPEGLINWLQERIAGAADDDGEEEYENFDCAPQ